MFRHVTSCFTLASALTHCQLSLLLLLYMFYSLILNENNFNKQLNLQNKNLNIYLVLLTGLLNYVFLGLKIVLWGVFEDKKENRYAMLNGSLT